MSFRSRFVMKMRPTPGALEMQESSLDIVDPESVAVKIRCASICGTDLGIVDWSKWAARNYAPPFPLGHEFSGEIVEIGRQVNRLKVGDRVCAETHIACGQCEQCRINRRHTCLNLKLFSQQGWGCFSDYTIVPQDVLRKVPPTIPYDKAAVLEPLGISVRSVMALDVRGANLLVVGCGPIGLFTVAVAKLLGAARIVASDLVSDRRRLACEVGADGVVDPRACSLAQQIDEMPHLGKIDAAIDTTGRAEAIREALAILRPGGQLIVVGLSGERVQLDVGRHIVAREIAVRGIYGRLIDETWVQVERLLGAYPMRIDPIVTHAFSLDQFPHAFDVASTRKSGKVMFRLDD